MSENRSISGQGSPLSTRSDTICIDTYRVLDSCRDRDCYEDVRIYTDARGQSVINQTCNIRVTDAEIIACTVSVDEVPFNDCFYSLDIRYYIAISAEGCTGPQNGRQGFGGCAIISKKVVLWGGEGNVSIFKSTDSSFCNPEVICSNNMPVGVVETVAPIALSAKVLDCSCECNSDKCCECSEIPSFVTDRMGELIDPIEGNRLYVSLGIFSVIRIERPAQYLVNATNYSVPEKECVTSDESNPCSLFRSMAFPVEEFTPTGNCAEPSNRSANGRCGCNNGRN